MKIGIAGPIALNLLNFDFKGREIPTAHTFPIISFLINALLKRGHQIVVYTTSSGIKEPFVLEDPTLTICIARNEPHAGRDLFKSERADLVYLMRKYPADIINAHWSYEYGWAAIDSGLPTVVTVRDHATTVVKYEPNPYRIMRWIMNYHVLNRAKYLTTNSHYLRQLLTKKQQQKATVISNFYASELEKHFASSANKSNYILSVNNGFNNRKNVGNGLKAFALIRKKYPDLKYYLIGHGMEEGGPAQNFATKHQLLNGVVFMGARSYKEVIEAIKNAKALLHTSREESFGNTVLEAMVVGTPAVGGNKSGNIPFMLNNGDAGLLCNINSPADIAKTVIKVLDDDTYVSHLRQKGYEYATNNFSEEAVINKYIAVYKKAMEWG